MRILIILLLGLSLDGCQLDLDDEFYFEKIAATNIQIPENMHVDETYTISFDYALVDGCHHFNEIDYCVVNATTRIITPFARVQNNVNCTQSITTGTHSFEFSPTQAGEYILKFWKNVNNSGIDEYEEFVINIE